MKAFSVNDYNAGRRALSDAACEADSALLTLCRISKIVTDNAMSDNEHGDKLSETMKNILLFLRENSGATQLEIVKGTNTKAPTVTVSLQKLESLGYVTRKNDLIDLRSLRVYLTEKGIEFCGGYVKALKGYENAAYKDMSEEEIKAFSELSLKVLHSLSEE